jgi:hypothetical protein
VFGVKGGNHYHYLIKVVTVQIGWYKRTGKLTTFNYDSSIIKFQKWKLSKTVMVQELNVHSFTQKKTQKNFNKTPHLQSLS